jgi:hypothetical protein
MKNKKNYMKKFVILMVLCLFSCSPKTYTFMGKKMTEKKFNRKLHKYTVKFIESNPEFVELWQGVEVVYDTIKK